MAKVNIDQDLYPSNSRKEKEKPVREPAKKVVSGKVKVHKKNELEKAAGEFFMRDVSSIGLYILRDVLIPAAKDMLWEMGSGALSMWLFEDTRRTGRPSKTGSRVNYGGYFNKMEKRPHRDRENSFDLDEIRFESRQDASEVLDTLLDIIDRYGQASIADYLSACGENTYPHTAFKFGWENLGSADVQRVYGGDYILKLPTPRPLE